VTESAGAVTTNPLLVDPLSEVARKERLYLLGVSTVSVTIVLTRLVPTEIRALGITFERADRESLLFILALVVGYFLVAFMIYAASDFLAWRNLFLDRVRNYRRQALEAEMLGEELDAALDLTPEQQTQRMRIMIERRVQELEEEERYHFPWRYRMPGLVSFIRVLFEFGLPVLYGIVAIVLLLFVGLPPADSEASLEFIRAHSA
jgi:hypothetical protein